MIYGFERPLFGNIALRTHLVVGDRWAMMIDTAMLGFEDMVQEALDLLAQRGVPLAFIVNTHARHDHIGLNGWVQSQTAACVVGHPWGRRWTENPDLNYREFVLGFPDIIEDSPALRQEVRLTMGSPVRVDVGVTGREHFYPGGLDVEVIDLSGHVPGEVGLLVNEERTLITGDILIGLNLPMFHGYVDPERFCQSLETIRGLVASGRVTRLISAHLPDLQDATEILEQVAQRQRAVGDIESLILEQAQRDALSLRAIWLRTSEATGKRPEFRGLAMVASHLHQLCDVGRMEEQRGCYRTL